MASKADTESSEALAQMRQIDPALDYFAATLLGSEAGWSLSFQSRFVGWPDGKGPDEGIELREASPVYPDRMTRLWDDLGQGWVVVKTRLQLAWFFRIGGNALITRELCHAHLEDHVRPSPVVKAGALGFVSYDPESRIVSHRRPTTAERMRVLERDGFRCQLCGERPAENEHVVLHVHHIRPFGKGGLTTEENLITLCHTCHDGLEPHEKPALFYIAGGPIERELNRQNGQSFKRDQAAYQSIASRVLAAMSE